MTTTLTKPATEVKPFAGLLTVDPATITSVPGGTQDTAVGITVELGCGVDADGTIRPWLTASGPLPAAADQAREAWAAIRQRVEAEKDDFAARVRQTPEFEAARVARATLQLALTVVAEAEAAVRDAKDAVQGALHGDRDPRPSQRQLRDAEQQVADARQWVETARNRTVGPERELNTLIKQMWSARRRQLEAQAAEVRRDVLPECAELLADLFAAAAANYLPIAAAVAEPCPKLDDLLADAPE